ncbi:Endoplasmic reticulum-Golgi intermediate compartment protein 3-like protein, partial [Drosera capensis]
SYLGTSTETKLVVDTSRGETLQIDFDIDFPSTSCTLLSVDADDISGEKHHDITHDIFKKRVDAHGKVIEVREDGIGAPKIQRPLQRHGGRLEHNETYCGSCYGAETSDDQCCNSCEEVHDAYEKKGWAMTNKDLIDQCEREGFFKKLQDEDGEGCSIHGSLQVNKVAGNFHFASGKSFHQTDAFLNDPIVFKREDYNWVQGTSAGMYQYFVKIVPTVYTNVRGGTIYSNQFSVTEHFRSSQSGLYVPGVFFFYDISPIKVTFTEKHMSFLHFITNVCAIVG